MKLPGYCTSCHKIKQVRVTNASIVKAQAKGSNVFEGICDACQQAEDDKRRSQSGRR